MAADFPFLGALIYVKLTVVCRGPEFSRRLRMSGIDDLATLVESA